MLRTTKIVAVVIAAILLSACGTSIPLDDEIGVVLDKQYEPERRWTECGYGYRFNPMTGDYEYMYGCDQNYEEEEYTLVVRWNPRRFKDEDGKVTTENLGVQSRWVSQTEYYMCNVGQTWNRTKNVCSAR